MCSVPIGDIEVSFPFNPYPAQVEYMQAVINALNNGTNALLESPTGTGKTLCLLCATLAWLEERRKNERIKCLNEQAGMTRVMYCSRTHAQLSQVIRELKRTRYGSVFSMSILGSREHMCVHPQVLNLRTAHAQQSMCNTLREEKNCRYYRGFQSRSSQNAIEINDSEVHDMEDLVSKGRSCGFCPYYMEREQAKEADIVFLPYNYMFDLSLRKQLPFEVKKSILIVDEAHNLPSILGSSSCMNLLPLDLTNAIHDCSRALAMQRLMMESASDDDPQESLMDEQEISSLKIILCGLETRINEEKNEQNEKSTKTSNKIVVTSSEEIVREGSYMIPFLAKALITKKLFTGGNQQGGGINDVMTKAITILAQSEGAATGLAKVQQFLNFVFEHNDEGDEDACRFVIQSVKGMDGRQMQRSLGYWCLDTSRTVQRLVSGLRSLLLTSGTLSPLDHFAAELGLCFDVSLKGSHVIQPHQVVGSVLCKGPGGERLNGSYVFRGRTDYQVGLGMCLVNLARHTPGGVLVFFPSYAALGTAVAVWRAGGEEKEKKEKEGEEGAGELTVWGRLAALKPVFVEPASAADLPAIVAAFQRAVDAAPARGAILLAVCRGKISEGVDFADHHGRCVVVAGIPFANHTDLFVRLKRDYITSVAPQRPKVQGKLFTGDDWYINESMRAVNQCVGRVIRHKDDYGAVLLADERYANQLGGLSKWVGERCSVHREFRETYACIAKFFASFRRRMCDGLLRSSNCTDSSSSFYNTTISGSVTLGSISMVPKAEEIPDSAEKAKRFAAEQMNKVTAEKVGQIQKCLAEAEEVPSLALHDSFPTSKETPVSALSPLPLPSTITRSETVSQPPLFKKQVLPVLPALPESKEKTEVKTLVGSTSKEFCLFMKKKLQPASYDKFRDKLKQIASIRDTPNLSVDAKKRGLDAAVDDLAVLFREAAAEHEKDLLLAFAQHIPAEFRPYFTHLLQKRRRAS
ncbi:helicase [Trypanosoma theileri]|uniref:Helicase n=1 Tax=Trypanosoma theileri TaxID=67003 RepID=A0A1X0P9Z9_9TRYP|nr:helicase [Trypanosoma theileri]ORC93419.1 helicase [Trypanosoma theileri]